MAVIARTEYQGDKLVFPAAHEISNAWSSFDMIDPTGPQFTTDDEHTHLHPFSVGGDTDQQARKRADRAVTQVIAELSHVPGFAILDIRERVSRATTNSKANIALEMIYVVESRHRTSGWTSYGADPNARFWKDPTTIVHRAPSQPNPENSGRFTGGATRFTSSPDGLLNDDWAEELLRMFGNK